MSGQRTVREKGGLPPSRRHCRKRPASCPEHSILEKEPTRARKPQRTGKNGVRLKRKRGTPLEDQGLRLHTSTAGDMGSIPELRFPRAM